MKEDEPLEVQLSEEIARLFDLFVRRMAKVKATDDRADRDMRHGTTESLDGIHDSGVTATGHENTVGSGGEKIYVSFEISNEIDDARIKVSLHPRRLQHKVFRCNFLI